MVKLTLFYNGCKFCDGSITFHTMFGLSTTFWMALLSRFLLGSFNGMLATVKVRMTSVVMLAVSMHRGELFNILRVS